VVAIRGLSSTTQCAKDCGPHNRACKYRHARLHGSQFLSHVEFRNGGPCKPGGRYSEVVVKSGLTVLVKSTDFLDIFFPMIPLAIKSKMQAKMIPNWTYIWSHYQKVFSHSNSKKLVYLIMKTNSKWPSFLKSTWVKLFMKWRPGSLEQIQLSVQEEEGRCLIQLS